MCHAPIFLLTPSAKPGDAPVTDPGFRARQFPVVFKVLPPHVPGNASNWKHIKWTRCIGQRTNSTEVALTCEVWNATRHGTSATAYQVAVTTATINWTPVLDPPKNLSKNFGQMSLDDLEQAEADRRCGGKQKFESHASADACERRCRSIRGKDAALAQLRSRHLFRHHRSNEERNPEAHCGMFHGAGEVSCFEWMRFIVWRFGCGHRKALGMHSKIPATSNFSAEIRLFMRADAAITGATK